MRKDELAAVKQLATMKKDAQSVMDKLEEPSSNLQAFIAKQTFSMLPDVVKEPLQDALQKMINVFKQAEEAVNSEVAVVVPALKDVQ
jgi:hypothetical protein